MTFKNIKFDESELLKSFEKLAQEKGLIKNDPVIKTASKSRINGPTNNLMENIITLCEKLDKAGLKAYSEDLQTKFFIYKKAQALYETAPHGGEDMIETAHPDGSHKIDAIGNGVMHTILDIHLNMVKMVNKEPTGKLSKANEIINNVKKALGQDAGTLKKAIDWHMSKAKQLLKQIEYIWNGGNIGSYDPTKVSFKLENVDINKINEMIDTVTNGRDWIYRQYSGWISERPIGNKQGRAEADSKWEKIEKFNKDLSTEIDQVEKLIEPYKKSLNKSGGKVNTVKKIAEENINYENEVEKKRLAVVAQIDSANIIINKIKKNPELKNNENVYMVTYKKDLSDFDNVINLLNNVYINISSFLMSYEDFSDKNDKTFAYSVIPYLNNLNICIKQAKSWKKDFDQTVLNKNKQNRINLMEDNAQIVEKSQNIKDLETVTINRLTDAQAKIAIILPQIKNKFSDKAIEASTTYINNIKTQIETLLTQIKNTTDINVATENDKVSQTILFKVQKAQQKMGL